MENKSNGILFESDTHVMVELSNGYDKITLKKDGITIHENFRNGKTYYHLYHHQNSFTIKEETYYALLETLFGDGVKARIKIMESAGVISSPSKSIAATLSASPSATVSCSPSPSDGY